MKVIGYKEAIKELQAGAKMHFMGGLNPYYFLSGSMRTLQFRTATKLIDEGLVKQVKDTIYVWSGQPADPGEDRRVRNNTVSSSLAPTRAAGSLRRVK